MSYTRIARADAPGDAMAMQRQCNYSAIIVPARHGTTLARRSMEERGDE